MLILQFKQGTSVVPDPVNFGYRVVGPAGGIQLAGGSAEIGPDGSLYVPMYDNSADRTTIFKYDGSSDYDPVWARTFNADLRGPVHIGADNSVYMMGSYSSGGYHGATVKLDGATGGTVDWQEKFFTNASSFDTVGAVDSNGNVYRGFSSFLISSGISAIIVKYNSTGTQQWQVALRDAATGASSNTRVYGMQTDSSGNLYVSGYASFDGDPFNPYVCKFDASGNVLWMSTVDSPGGESIFYDIAIDETTGRVFAGGRYQSTQYFAMLCEFNPSTGALLNQRSYTTATTSIPFGFDNITIRNGSLYAFGAENLGGGIWGPTIVKYDLATLNVTWQRQISPNSSVGGNVWGTVDAGGNVIVAGTTNELSSNSDMVIWRFPDTITLPETQTDFTIDDVSHSSNTTSLSLAALSPVTTSLFTLTYSTPTFSTTAVSPATAKDVTVVNW